MADYAGDVLELMDRLEIRDATVCGVSMGGYVAFAMLRLAAERMSGLVLAHTRASADTPAAREGRDRMIALARRRGSSGDRARDGAEAPRRDDPARAAGGGRQPCARSSKPTRRRPSSPRSARSKTRPDSTPLLASIRCPTTIVHGEEDTIVPLADAEAMHHGIAGSRLIVVPGWAHRGGRWTFHSFAGFGARERDVPPVL